METSLSPQAGEHRDHESIACHIPLIPRHGSELEEGHEAGDRPGGCSWVLVRSWRGRDAHSSLGHGARRGVCRAPVGQGEKKIKIRWDDDSY